MAAPRKAFPQTTHAVRIQTAATELLGIRHPVLLAGMFAVSSPKLAAAVTNAGGLGVIGGGAYKPDQLRKALDELKGYLIDKSAPFGVDLLIPQVGGNARKTNYDYSQGKLDDLIEVIIESGAKLFVCAVGIPPARVVDRLHAGGVLYMNMVGHPHHAQKAIDAGTDLLCAQGGEGGGHTGDIPTVILVPAIAKVIGGQKSRFTGKEVALIAGGGIFNGQSLAAALMLGASAVWIGTRFILCDEAGASVLHQQALLGANHGDIIRTTVFTGRPLHAKATPYLRRWEEQRREEKLQLQSQGIIPISRDLETKPEDEEVLDNAHPVLMGKVAPMVTEKLPAKRIVEEMVEEAAHLECRRRKIKCSGQTPCDSCCLESTECHYSTGPARIRKRRPSLPSTSSPLTSSNEECPQAGALTVESCQEHGQSQEVSTDSAVSPAWQRDLSSTASRQAPFPTTTAGVSPYNSYDVDASIWNVQAKLLEVQRMRTMVRHYMVKVNPWVPCINGAQLNGGIEGLLAGRRPAHDQRQMVVMIDLIMALVQIMTDERTHNSRFVIAGWVEFQRAERLLNSLAWDGIANLKIIQCLILKTMYLIYADKEELAYDTVASMSRMCFRLGLHNEKGWDLCSQFEVHLRQRILWTVFCLERHVVQTCKLPYLIRHSDLQVALPRQIEDSKLQTDLEVLPPEDPGAYIHHIYFCYQHGVLFTEVYDCLMSHGASGSADQALTAQLDARILSLRCEMPHYLQWRPDRLAYTQQFDMIESFRIRESLLLHLLLNNLRLLLRQPFSQKPDGIRSAMLTESVEIAADTINSLQTYYQSPLPDPIQRHASVRFLLQSLYILVEVIENSLALLTTTSRQARESFVRGVSLLEEFASHLPLARSGLVEVQKAAERISIIPEECLLTGSLDECSQWFDFLDMDRLEDSCDINGIALDLQAPDVVATQPATWPLQYIHTDSWLM